MPYKYDPMVERARSVFDSLKLTRPTADLFFRKMMVDNPQAAIHLLNRIMHNKLLSHSTGLAPEKIESIYFLNPELPPEVNGDKLVRLDIVAKCSNGAVIDIEMQCGHPGSVEKRAAFYLSRLVSGTVKEGDDYKPIPPCAVVFILENPYFAHWDAGHSRFEFRMTHPQVPNPPKLGEDLPWLEFVELSKLRASLPPEDEVLKNWIRFLLPQSHEEWLQVTTEEPMFADLKTKVEKYSADEKLVMRQRAIDEGNLGRAIDLGEAKAEGRAEGREETLHKAAHGMVEAGISHQVICKALQITEAELTELLKP